MQENKDKVAIVTGAAKNIGRATSECLSKLGFNILVHANSDKDGAMETLDIVKKNGVNAGILIGDLTNKETSKLLEREGQKLGIISVLINNASQREFNKFDDMTFENDIGTDAFLTGRVGLTLILEHIRNHDLTESEIDKILGL